MESKIIKVSVIIPVYNVEQFLCETIESVLTQSLQEIELILVNDGSKDRSEEIGKEYQQRDSRVKYYYQENAGVSAARNHGLDYATGEYVFFMDSDDTIDSNLIESSYNVAKRDDSDIVVVGDYFCKRIKYVKVLPTCAQMIRNAFLKEHSDIRFPIGIQPCEDGLFSHQLLMLTDKTSLNPDGQYIYREHDNQNHLIINKNSAKVLSQIPSWFSILERSYSRYALHSSKALELAKFVEHEPFEFRYMAMPFDAEQKIYLHKIIVGFMADNVTPYVSPKELKMLSLEFRAFLEAKDVHEFEQKRPSLKRKKKLLKILGKLKKIFRK